MRVGLDAAPLLKAAHKRSGTATYVERLALALLRLPEAPELTLIFPSRRRDVALHPGLAELPRRRSTGSRFLDNLLLPVFGRRRLDLAHHTRSKLEFVAASREVVTIHDVYDLAERLDERGSAHRRKVIEEKYALIRQARAPVITDSNFSKAEIVRYLDLDPERIDVVPLGVEERFRPHRPAELLPLRTRLGLDRPYLLFVGSLCTRKNVTGAIAAFLRTCRASDLPHEFLLAGKAEGSILDQLRSDLAASPHGARVRILGHVADEDLPALMAGAAAFFFPSLYEGFGLPVLEAMASGVPVVCAGETSLREVAGDAALLVDPRDLESGAQALGRVLGDPALAADLSARGRARAATFTWERTAALTMQAYRRALEGVMA